MLGSDWAAADALIFHRSFSLPKKYIYIRTVVEDFFGYSGEFCSGINNEVFRSLRVFFFCIVPFACKARVCTTVTQSVSALKASTAYKTPFHTYRSSRHRFFTSDDRGD